MILRRPNAILHVTTKSARPDLSKPFRVIEKGKVLFNLNVTEVVPVTDLRRVQFVEQRRQLALAWDFFVTAATFDSEFYFFRGGVFHDPLQTIFHALHVRGRSGFALLDRANLLPNIITRQELAV